MARKLCVTCGESEKRKGHPKHCDECWLVRQPPDVQVAASKRRLALVPEELRMARAPRADAAAMAEIGRRWCAGCQSWVRLRDCGSSSQCKGCRTAATHAAHVARTYGMADGDYAELLAAQGGVCHLCGRAPKARRLAVDHDHATGRVRALLCGGTDSTCNVSVVGTIEHIAQDSAVAYAQRLLAYLQGQTPATALWGEDCPVAPTSVGL